MSGMDFEYAIKKDVRNNPIVREIDQARQRQLLQTLVIGGFLSLVILFSAWQRFALLGHGYEMQRMQRERAMRLRRGSRPTRTAAQPACNISIDVPDPSSRSAARSSSWA